ncbi:UDP-N-acetylmuramoylalanyl-D-glutamate--2,6-diam inopimelate ligase MurE [Erythrobacter litoralis]|uniref:UDP-N-acetylmuramoyl-L-alanyl-D-glutamate--2,6-diaminopimelate ligase n=2 Tax=Erythrobacter TaxID=1041 RepID=A0A074MIT8_9SPHN|nr:UDP-N-acetylmuramoyl-L-alanyl-D-glutamate--2,6-diaminopimelate ligase [Erythrobacter litoralis]AOL24343.1 UDP-N-acetylmuramoylalanyl-D-glutamate--2,6-diam inopimelate ligase MurE [Erythrobacter litoralis]KEO93414.1 UDP-N-acetylmuramoylalanyl-D-glutamate--2,6-diaminopimelate ligase [Erythrobacter litoralis]
MRLSALLEAAGLEPAGEWSDAAVSGFAIDHRKVAPGTVFGAFRGERFNAEDVIPQAIEAGAVAVVASPEARVEGAAHVASEEPRRAFARLAARFFEPVPETLVAVTGTNGKTSTAEMTRQIWRMCGRSAASIGTLGVTTPDGSVSTGLTTPDIVTFLANMAGLAREGVTHVAYEASSHGLAQYRNEGLTLAASAFTNFSRDHLDYHGTMEAYFEAKMRLFDEVAQPASPAVIFDGGRDEVWIPKAIERAKARGLDVRSVGEKGRFLRLTAREATQLGQVLTVEFEGSARTIKLPLIGEYQAANALVAAGLALSTGCEAGQVFDALSRLQPVRGRLERAAIAPVGAPVYVDYAHTPDAMEAAIAALRGHVDDARGGRLTVVFGAGGDRDPGKRAPMGDVAARGAERVIVTDDNPRGEDAGAIRAAILEGARGAGGEAEIIEVAGRRDAIAEAIAGAGDHDIILVAGKGHEQGQIIGSGDDMRVLPFDDVEVARECAGRRNRDTGR